MAHTQLFKPEVRYTANGRSFKLLKLQLKFHGLIELLQVARVHYVTKQIIKKATGCMHTCLALHCNALCMCTQQVVHAI